MNEEEKTKQELISELRALRERIEGLEKLESAGKREMEERGHLIVQLREALSECIKMSGLLPVCSRCGKMREDKEYWDRIHRYLEERSSKEPSLTLCPRCARESREDK